MIVAAGAGSGFDIGMKSLAVQVLGDFGVDGIELQALGSKKARMALHLLALAQGHAVRSGRADRRAVGRRVASEPR